MRGMKGSHDVLFLTQICCNSHTVGLSLSLFTFSSISNQIVLVACAEYNTLKCLLTSP
jgi:hypothetical protein